MESGKTQETYDIAIIGYSQAGKTTLAVGLYATSTPDFTVTGVNEDTEYYLRGRRAMMEAGQWLDSTQERNRPELSLSLRRLNKAPVVVRFKEYMGELAENSESYKRDIVGKPRGALILINPKMEIMSDVVRRVEMIAQIKDLIGYLSSPEVGCAYIGLVTTASDLLEDVDSEEVKRFEECKIELINCLRTSAYKEDIGWKSFSVSVSGNLKDRNVAQIAHGEFNTSRVPFEWLIDRIQSNDRRSRIRRRCKAVTISMASCALLASALLGAFYWGFDRSFERHITQRAVNISNEVDAACKKAEAAELEKCCQKLETIIDEAIRHQCRFARNGQRISAFVGERRAELDKVGLVYYPIILEQLKEDAQEKASEDCCKGVRARIDAWAPTTVAARDCRTNLLDRFDKVHDEVRTRYESHQFDIRAGMLVRRLDEFVCKDSFEDQLRELLRKCREFERCVKEEFAPPYVDIDVRTNAWKAISCSREQALNRLIEWQMGCLEIHAAGKPELQAKDRERLHDILGKDDVIGPSDYAAWVRALNDALARRQEEWENYQNELCDKEIEKIKGARSGYDAVLDFRLFYSGVLNPPGLDRVVLALHTKVGEDFQRLVKELQTRRENNAGIGSQNYERLCTLCMGLIQTDCPELQRSCWYKFAQDCVDKGKIDLGMNKAFRQTYRFKRLEFAANGQPSGGRKRGRFYLGEKQGELFLDRGRSTIGLDYELSCNYWDGHNIGLKLEFDGKWINAPVYELGDVHDWDGGMPSCLKWTGNSCGVPFTIMVYFDHEGESIVDYLPKNTKLVY